MKKSIILLLILLLVSQFTALQAQEGTNEEVKERITIVGIILDENGLPPQSMFVVEKGTYNSVSTDENGNYEITVLPDAELQLVLNGILVKTIRLNDREQSIASVDGFYSVNVIYNSKTETLSSGGSASMKNYWIGAKIGYNFMGETDDNFFVGSASIALNMFKGSSDEHSFAIVGNLGNFKFDKENDNSDDIKKIVQSINGLSIGLGYTREFALSEKNEFFFRYFGRTGVRMVTFDDIGEDMESVNLAQFANNIGMEFELGNFENGGRIAIATGITMYLFDENVYQRIFEDDKNSLFTFDTTVILPISKDLGLFVNGTFAKDTSAAYILGIIFNTK